MPEETLDVMRKTVEAFNSGDDAGLLETFDPDVVFEPQRASIQGAYRGHAGVLEWVADTRENFAAFRLDITDRRDLGGDRVLSIGTLHLRGRGSEVETDVPTAAIATLRQGKIVSLKDYGDRDKALEAAGLLE